MLGPEAAGLEDVQTVDSRGFWRKRFARLLPLSRRALALKISAYSVRRYRYSSFKLACAWTSDYALPGAEKV